MLIREGRLAGLGLTPLDDDDQSQLHRIDISTLLTLTPHNYGKRKVGVEDLLLENCLMTLGR